MYHYASRRISLSLVCLAAAAAGTATFHSPSGVSIQVAPTGSYTISTSSPAWTFGGNVGRPLSSITTASGTDSVGSYTEITFSYLVDGPRRGAIRAYADRSAVLFTDYYDSNVPNDSPFPVLAQYPQLPFHLTFAGMFATPSFPGWAPESPWILWDNDKNTFLISPADHFMTASTTWDSQNRLVSGIDPGIATFPSGFEHKTILMIGQGLNQSFDAWGHTMTDFYQKIRPANDADPTLRQLGYWTDNGATYYYRQDSNLSYEDTLYAVKAGFDTIGIQLGYMQLDSWFYPKGPNQEWQDLSDGIYLYEAAPEIFPNGLKAFQQKLGVPLVTHARWIDTTSPYRQQYQMSGNVITDPLYWNSLAGYLQDSGVIVYEQDWLDLNAIPNFNLTDPDEFLGNMSASTTQLGVDMQFCMSTPRHYMHSLKLPNLTTVRTSQDRFGPTRWTNFLYSSRLASAVGVWPFTDVFMSGEKQNLVLAVLSGGPVGVGDGLGELNKSNLLRAARSDGVIVKPDVVLTPTDASFFSHAGGDMTQPMVASTYSAFGNWRATYIVGYDQGTGTYPTLTFSDFGLTGAGYLYDALADTVTPVNPASPYPTPVGGFSYAILAPTGPSGITLLGDRNQFAAFGKQRITAFSDDGLVRVSVAFAASETNRTLQGVAPAKPRAKAISGKVIRSSYNPTSQRFSVEVAPDESGSATIVLSCPHPSPPPQIVSSVQPEEL
jgi:hypothetical protein